MCKRLWLPLVCSLVIALIGNQAVSAQTQATGTIEGLIRDERSAVIAGAKVSARHLGTNTVREVLTDASGRYRIVFLPPGPYEVTAEMPGFATVTQSGITVLVGGTATVDFTLKVAPVAETVTVTAEARLWSLSARNSPRWSTNRLFIISPSMGGGGRTSSCSRRG